MSDENKNANPFDSSNFSTGGGLWDGKVVTITSAKATVDLFTKVDGSAWINEKGEQGKQNVLAVTGIAEDSDQEIRQTYSSGGLVPTEDGEGFQKADGTPGFLHKNSGAGKFFDALKAIGFDLSKLFVDGHQKLSGLTGAKIQFVGVDKLDKDGKQKKNKKGYVQQDFMPAKFIGYAAGVAGQSSVAAGAGAKDESVALVTSLLAANGGKLTKSDMLRKVAGQVIGKPNGNAILTLIAKDTFHEGQAWTFDGTALSL